MRRIKQSLLLVAVLAAVCAPGLAQQAVPGSGPSTFDLPAIEAFQGSEAGWPEGSQTVVLRGILMRGNRAIASAELDKLAAGYIGRPVAAADLEGLRLSLTRLYVQRGFVNSGALYLPGALVAGMLTVDLVEGRLVAIRTSGLGGLQEAYVLDRLGLAAGSVLNVEDLRERFALLLEDPLFARANARLTPGMRLGEAWLDVDFVRARPHQVTVFANNYRPPSVGDSAYGASGVVRNVTGWGDALEASYQDPIGSGGHGGRGNITWTFPIPHTRVELIAQHDEGSSSVVEAALRPLDIRSKLRSDEAGLRWVLHETMQNKLSLGLAHSWRENRTTLLGEPFSFTPFEPDGVSSVRAWRLWQQASMRSATQLVAVRSTFTKARNNLQDIPGLPASVAASPPHAYTYWQGQGQFVREVAEDGAQIVIRTAVQAATDPLVALDRFSMGGASSVRGFRENTLVRDRGVVVNLEFEYPVTMPMVGEARLTLIPFVDYARGQNVDATADTMSSAGVALRARWKGLGVDLAFGRKLIRPTSVTPTQGSLQDRGIHFQVSFTPP